MAASEIAIRAKIRKYKSIFLKAHATSSDRAIQPWDYGVKKGIIFNKLVRQKIIISAGNDKYYIDELRDRSLRQRSNIITVIILIIFILIVFAFFMSKFI